ncbi:MAG: hypothetical protein V4628_11550 [Pseudomonadota bacterium]
MTIKSPESKDGGPVLTRGTKVTLQDGSEITGITGMTVTYALDDIVRASIDLIVTPETIKANAILSLKSVEFAAKYYGYKLVEL